MLIVMQDANSSISNHAAYEPNVMKKTDWPIRWDLLLRYRLIEIIALWEGRLTTNHICHAFGIGRQQASKDINTYLREIAPENLTYDRHLKGYVPTRAFRPAVTLGQWREYRDLISRDDDLKQNFEDLDIGLPNTELVRLPGQAGKPEVLRPLIQTIRQNRRADIHWVSLESTRPQADQIEPHSLVCIGSHWFIRTWSEVAGGYANLRVSRLRGEPRLRSTKARHRRDKDAAWQERVAISLRPHSSFSQVQQSVIAEDFGMSDGELTLSVRQALVPLVMAQLPLGVGNEPDPNRPLALIERR
ncbi:MAG: hypothetical protein CL583_05570 [Alteromonadaceae bacterium]|uniref:WYL domain-containing protein n=1 Tax=Hydrocarboniclastica marina TaxID=2259620 RepID=A0A4P7XEQ2_9ALTE|nr:hypothetical protein [Alteromonadaceae bacterium]QCF24572.1 hypothetical protein soil367_00600 [Hydrocarboniclastica marina]